MNTTTDNATELYAERRKRFNDILDGYECGIGDFRIPMAATPTGGGLTGTVPLMRLATDLPEADAIKPGRFALVSESRKGHGYFIDNVADLADVEKTAVNSYHDGWVPVCYFDLDELAGDEPAPDEGDKVVILGGDLRTGVEGDAAGEWYVVGRESDTDEDYNVTFKVDLAREQDGDANTWHYSDHVRVIERALPDERMPKRYLLARLQVFAAFNSRAEPS